MVADSDLLEKLSDSFYRNRKIIAMFKTAREWTISNILYGSRRYITTFTTPLPHRPNPEPR